MYAVITAGGIVTADLAQAIGTDTKALAPLGNRRLIDPAIDAAREIGVTAIGVVGSREVGEHCGDRIDRMIAADARGTQNILLALRAFPNAERLVFLTSDLPFIEAPGLRTFVERSSGAELTMALAQAETYRAEFPGAPRHLIRLGREAFANGSAFVIERAAIAALEQVAGDFFSARKSLLRLAVLLGPVLALRYAFGRLRIADIERHATDVLGVRARAIVDAAPGLCYDVDDVADWAYAHSRMLARG